MKNTQLKKQHQGQKKKVIFISNQHRKDIVFGIVLSLIGLISAPIFLELGFNKNFDSNFYHNPILKVFAILGGILAVVTLIVIFLRIVTFQSTPQARPDPPSLVSVNEIYQNIITYWMVFLGIYVYMSKGVDIQSNFYYNRLPFVFLVSIIIELTGRLLQVATSFKGFRYIGHMLTFSVFVLMIVQIY